MAKRADHKNVRRKNRQPLTEWQRLNLEEFLLRIKIKLDAQKAS